jgi:hypothetical protein
MGGLADFSGFIDILFSLFALPGIFQIENLPESFPDDLIGFFIHKTQKELVHLLKGAMGVFEPDCKWQCIQ